MKVLIVVPNFDLEPTGLAYISAVLRRAGHAVDVLHKGETPLLGKTLAEKHYDAVATGGMSMNYALIKDIVDEAKKSDATVIVGGGIVTSEPELMTRDLDVHYSVIGEGEETIVELLGCLETGGDVSGVNGLAYVSDGEFKQTPERKAIMDLDALPMYDWNLLGFERRFGKVKPSDLFFYDLFDNPRAYPLIASRSCPFQCSFCYHPLGRKYRQRSVDNIMAELKEAITKYRINVVAIYDELFAYHLERVDEFCKKFTEFTSTLAWDVKWYCQMRVDRLKEDMLDAMRRAGCYMISFGFESYSPTVLKSMNKKIAPEMIHRALHITLDRNIGIQANFIFGDVAETPETIDETLAFWKEHMSAGILLGFVLPVPDSKIYRYCHEKGIIKDRLDFIKNHINDIYNMTQMNDREFALQRLKIMRHAMTFVPKTYPTGVTEDSVTVQCPHCTNTMTYGNYDITASNHLIFGIRPGRRIYNKLMYCRSCHHRFYVRSHLYDRYRDVVLFFAKPALFRLYLNVKKLLTGRDR